MLGGLLVSIAFIGLLAAHRASTTPPETTWLVAVRSIPSGAVITADDLGLAAMTLVESTRGRAFSDPDDVIGHRTLTPITEGDLIQRSGISASGEEVEATRARRLSLELDPAQALNGELSPGDEVDVLSTPSSGSAGMGVTRTITRRSLVQSVASADELAIGAAGKVRLTLVVADEATAVAIVDADAAGRIHLIATSAMRPAEEPAPATPTDATAATSIAPAATAAPPLPTTTVTAG